VRDALAEVADRRTRYWQQAGLSVTAESLDAFIEHEASTEIARVVKACCAFGAQIQSKQPSRGTGKRRKLPIPTPKLTVRTPSGGGQPNRPKDLLIQQLGLIFYELTEQNPAGDAAFADLVRDVFTVADIKGADERIREYRNALAGKSKRPHRR
jgi:hypothetical protein